MKRFFSILSKVAHAQRGVAAKIQSIPEIYQPWRNLPKFDTAKIWVPIQKARPYAAIPIYSKPNAPEREQPWRKFLRFDEEQKIWIPIGQADPTAILTSSTPRRVIRASTNKIQFADEPTTNPCQTADLVGERTESWTGLREEAAGFQAENVRS